MDLPKVFVTIPSGIEFPAPGLPTGRQVSALRSVSNKKSRLSAGLIVDSVLVKLLTYHFKINIGRFAIAEINMSFVGAKLFHIIGD